MRLLLVDDHPAFRNGLRTLLSTVAEIEVVGEAANGAEAVDAFRRLQPEITLMDVRMPTMDGITAIETIRARDSDACILVLTTFDEDDLVAKAIRAGASGYLLKGMPVDDIVQVLKLASRGYTALAPGVVRGAVVAPKSPESPALVDAARRTGDLSERQREILALLATGCTNREIAQRLALTEGTVKNYISAILGTLGLRHRTEAALLWRALTQPPPGLEA